MGSMHASSSTLKHTKKKQWCLFAAREGATSDRRCQKEQGRMQCHARGTETVSDGIGRSDELLAATAEIVRNGGCEAGWSATQKRPLRRKSG